MFENYTDRIVLTGNADDQFFDRVVSHISDPTGPVRVSGGPGTAKFYTINKAAREAGFTTVVVDTPTLATGDQLSLASSIDMAEHQVVLVIEFNGESTSDTQVTGLLPALRDIAALPRVHATFVVHTV